MFEVQGHRGARGLRPESTLPSFEVALDLCVPTLELDLHLSKDDHVVVWHDPSFTSQKCSQRDGSPLERDVFVRSLDVQDLANFRCDNNPGPQRFGLQTAQATELAGQRFNPVTLTELFAFVAAYQVSAKKTFEQRRNAERVRFNIETKRVTEQPDTIGDDFDGITAGELEKSLLQAIDDAHVATRVTVQSFDHRSLWAIAAIRPDIRLSALTSDIVPNMENLAQSGASIWSPSFEVVTPGTIRDAHSSGLEVLAWTVNDVETMIRLKEMGVDGIITDRPDLAMGVQ